MKQLITSITSDLCGELVELVSILQCLHRCCTACFISYCTTDIRMKIPLKCFRVRCTSLLAADRDT